MKRLPGWTCLFTLVTGCAAPAVRHTVQYGETAGSLAASVGATERELRALNRLGPEDRLRPGDTVFLPAPRPRTATVEHPAAAPPSTPAPAVAQPSPVPGPTARASGPPPSRRETARLEPPRPAAVPPERPRPAPALPPAAPPPQAPREAAESGKASALRWPVSGEVLRGFGRGPAGDNRGIDVAAAVGTKARAAAAGKVLYAGTPVQAYGPLVILEHAGGLHTVYSNLREALVVKGAQVAAGEAVGSTGETSRSLPPHLHFEVRRKGEPVDPLLILPRP